VSGEGRGGSPANRVSQYLRGNVLGLVAIFIALSGTAWAGATIGSSDIQDDAVLSRHIKDGQVKTPDLGNFQVTRGKIADGAVNSGKVADGSLTGADVAPNALGGGQIDESSLDSSVLQRRVTGNCASGNAIRAVDAAGNVTCEGVGGGGAPTGPAGGDLTGTYPDPTIGPDAVGANEIVAGGVGSSEIAPSAVGGTDIATGAVSSSDVFDQSLTATDIANTSSLGNAEISQESLDIGIGKSVFDQTDCDDSDHNGEVCASMSFTLPRAEHILVLGTGDWRINTFDDSTQSQDAGDFTNLAIMSCVLRADGTPIGSGNEFGEQQAGVGTTPVHHGTDGADGMYSGTGVTGALAAGAHTLDVDCTDIDGNTVLENVRITAVSLD
jgi:hypothetical protein